VEPFPSADQTGTASTTLTADSVGTTRINLEYRELLDKAGFQLTRDDAQENAVSVWKSSAACHPIQ
jgi:hypothetical protein